METIKNSQKNNSQKPKYWIYSGLIVFVTITLLVFYQLLQYNDVLLFSTGIAAIMLFYGINGALKFYSTTEFLNKETKKKCFLYSVFLSVLLSVTAGLAIYIDKLAGWDELAVFILITSVFMFNKISRKVHAYLLLDTKKKKAQLQTIVYMSVLIFVWVTFFYTAVPSGVLSFIFGLIILVGFYKDLKPVNGEVKINESMVVLLAIAFVVSLNLFYMIISGETFIIDRSFLEINQ